MSEAMKVRDKAIKDFDAMWCGKFGFTSDGVKLDGTQITREQLYRYSRTLKDKGPRITFKPMEATIHLSEEDVKKGFEFVNGRNVQEIPFYRYEIPDIKSPRNLILQHAAKRLGYRGKRM